MPQTVAAVPVVILSGGQSGAADKGADGSQQSGDGWSTTADGRHSGAGQAVADGRHSESGAAALASSGIRQGAEAVVVAIICMGVRASALVGMTVIVVGLRTVEIALLLVADMVQVVFGPVEHVEVVEPAVGIDELVMQDGKEADDDSDANDDVEESVLEWE